MPERTLPTPLPTVLLEGMTIQAITEAQCVEHVMASLAAGRGGWVFTPNTDIMMRFHDDAEYRRCVARASLTVADGMPLLWACRLRGTPLPGRVCGSNLVSSVSEAAAREGRSVFLYGGHPDTARLAGERLQRMYPGLKIAGSYCPPIAPAGELAADAELHSLLEAGRPDVVFIALSSPKQDFFIREMRRRLPDAWWLGVGAGFSFLSDHLRRAPAWMQKTGLEWLHRLPQDPRRLGRRYLLNNFPFCLGLFRRALRDRMD